MSREHWGAVAGRPRGPGCTCAAVPACLDSAGAPQLLRFPVPRASAHQDFALFAGFSSVFPFVANWFYFPPIS